MTHSPAVFTVPPGVSFVDALAEVVLAEAADDPLRLSAATILVPTRRAARALRDAFLRQSEGRPLLLPRMLPLGDLDADEAGLLPEDEGGGPDQLELPPAISDLRRRLLLAQLIRAWGSRAGNSPAPPSPAQATALAAALARFLDQIQTERVEPAALAGLAGDFAEHWERTLAFLRILTEEWPRLLATTGAIDPAARRDRALAALARRWRAAPPVDPVIAAGSTGTIPATADLLGLVARLPTGRVVLPGLDTAVDVAAWPAIQADPTHPQHGMARLLHDLGLAPHAVPTWPSRGADAARPRARLAGAALLPAAASDLWPRAEWRAGAGLDPASVAAALAGVRRLDCAGPQEEAETIALLLREALETPGRTAALVTPDRAVARRVAAELGRWGIAIDDSAGTPLGETPPGAFLRLLADLFREDVAPVPLLALLKHPLAAAGLAPARLREAARRLERLVLRGPRPAAGFTGLRAAIGAGAGARDLARFVAGLDRATRPFARALARARTAPVDLVRAHVAAGEALARSDREDGARRLWRGEAGEAAARLVADLLDAARALAPIAGEAYPALFEELIQGIAVRPAWGRHPRLAIWGPLEARLQQADLLVVAGLNEGTWPALATPDPWLSRPMRRMVGLPAPERRIGLAAHDFAQAFAAPEVVLTRAERVDGAPTVPSRWLLRLDAVLRAAGRPEGLPGDPRLRALQVRLDQRERDAAGRAVPIPARPTPPPAPRPPFAARPRRLRVTEIETWLRDPYTIYARRILRLEPLDPLDADPGAAERGIAIHRALDAFLAAGVAPDAPEAMERLLALGEEAFGDALSRPAIRAFWWPRFTRIAAWVLRADAARRGDLAGSWAEAAGALRLDRPAGAFVLAGRADRVDRLRAGGLAILDYKTGAVPTAAAVEDGLAPQLPLEAAMAMAGAFPDIPPEAVAALAYWRLTGAAPEAGEVVTIAADAPTVARLSTAALDGLARLIDRFDDPDTAYLARPRPDHAPRWGNYDHLSRVAEWSGAVGVGGEA